MSRLILSSAFAFLISAFGVSCHPPQGSETIASAAVAKDAGPIKVGPNDWPWWRGPSEDGVASADQNPPLEWSETKNVLWKTPVPGRGHAAPTVVGDQIFLPTADEKSGAQSVLCLDRKAGKEVWKKAVHESGAKTEGHPKSSRASCTIACDGERVFVNFLNAGAVYTTALDLKGDQIWQTKITDYVVHQGYGSSPTLHGPLVIVSADNKGGGAIVGLNRVDGDEVWRVARPDKPNYVSPLVRSINSREQLIIYGCDLVSSFEPLTGKKLWEIEGATTESVSTTSTDGNLIFTCGGYPRNHVEAVRVDGAGSAKVAWSNGTRVYVPSMIVRDGNLYGIADAGVAHCWKASTGETVWKGRVPGTFTASPTLVGKHLFATNEAGKTYVLEVGLKEFKLVGENELEPSEVFSTPVYCGSRIYMRIARGRGDDRKEMLYCLGKP
jgi:outer membrane protein assembly factor BamB